ncbi:hypothetical protein G9C98_003094 [Cotesia typhae]|uniref:Uncharacterized protein n=1 Tax=Cotesia typhae TaxID=2053667 RepID=A0A8J5QL71_9HYME|nr:hypothetical protein G9C98_003094 [Cotesia typhae]
MVLNKGFYEKPLSILTKSLPADNHNEDFEDIKYGVQHLPSYSDPRISRPKLVNTNFMYYSTDKGLIFFTITINILYLDKVIKIKIL